MEEALQLFIQNNIGKHNLGDTTANKGECVGLIELWLDVLGVNDPHLWGNAVDLLNNADPIKFTIVKNDPNDTTQFPPDGAVVVLGKPFGIQPNGTYDGHTGLSIGSTGGELRLFQQNDPSGSTPGIKYYPYASCVGWLIPKVSLQGGEDVDQNAINGQKAVQFDKALTLLKNAGLLTTDDSNQFINSDSTKNNGFINFVANFITDYESQRNRAGWYDKVCVALGLTGDTNKIDYTQVLNKLENPDAVKKYNEIVSIING